MEERMGIKSQLPALALAIGLVTIALALLNADKIGEALILGVVALIAVRYWARRCADAYLAKLYTEGSARMGQKLPASGDRHPPRRPATPEGQRPTALTPADGRPASPRDWPARKA
jgi:hypothetical protein